MVGAGNHYISISLWRKKTTNLKLESLIPKFAAERIELENVSELSDDELVRLVSFQISRKVFLGLSASTIHAQRKCLLFELNSSNELFFLHVRTDHVTMAAGNFLDGCKKILWDRELMEWKPHISFKSKIVKNILYRNIQSYPIRHIFKWNIEKGTTLTASRKIDNSPPPARGFLTNSPLPGSTRWMVACSHHFVIFDNAEEQELGPLLKPVWSVTSNE